jgi:hypothetical protein
MKASMGQELSNHAADTSIAPEIEALLSLAKSHSIFDSVMALPSRDATFGNEWDRAVSQRLQSKTGLDTARPLGRRPLQEPPEPN